MTLSLFLDVECRATRSFTSKYNLLEPMCRGAVVMGVFRPVKDGSSIGEVGGSGSFAALSVGAIRSSFSVEIMRLLTVFGAGFVIFETGFSLGTGLGSAVRFFVFGHELKLKKTVRIVAMKLQ